ncbi:Uma2 family endonuclease [Streptomyces sp. SAJ15]|uniref:Uma2 family endonuclease n=1 Tax=Streptomyces sp. SAJ15 TaxID=2011095 RepID=UPI0028CB271C|nr:Uma2 family endonuclease [Streptomyces sp. SAJ15]
MTIELIDSRIEVEMGDSDRQYLDEMFEFLYDDIPEGFKAEIVEGAVAMSPQRDTHSDIVKDVLFQLGACFGRRSKLKMDVRLDLPGYRNGFCPDLFKLSDDAKQEEGRRWRYQDVEFVLEVISRETADNDYGKKLDAYAEGEIPVYLIADPYTGRWHLFLTPKDGEYLTKVTRDFGTPVDLTDTVLGLTLQTDEFPRD